MHMHFQDIPFTSLYPKAIKNSNTFAKGNSVKWVNTGMVSLPDLEIKLHRTMGMSTGQYL